MGARSPSASSAALGAVLRTEVQLPRAFDSYAIAETALATSVHGGASASTDSPVERLAFGWGRGSHPDETARWGHALGIRAELWHGELALPSRWAFGPALEAAPIIRLCKWVAPWEADGIVADAVELTPRFELHSLIGHADGRFQYAWGYSFTLSIGIHIWPTLVP